MFENFITELKEFQEYTFAVNERHGFNETDHQIDDLACHLQATDGDKYLPLVQMFRNARNGLRLMLIVSELVESLNALRTGNGPDDHLPAYKGFTVENADAIIRILNLCQSEKEPIAEALVAKAVYNDSRPYKHGGKAF